LLHPDNYIYVEVDDKSNIGPDNIDRDEDEKNKIEFEDTFCHTSCLTNSTEALSLDLVEQINKLKETYNSKNKTNPVNFDANWCAKIQYGNTPIQEYKNPLFLINAFPTLFPYGIGGIDSERKIKLSYRDHVKYLFRLANNAFRTHPSFLFVAFNIIQKSEARYRMSQLIKQSDFQQFSEEINTLTIEDFNEAAQVAVNHPNMKFNSTIFKLLSKVQQSSAKVQRIFL